MLLGKNLEKFGNKKALIINSTEFISYKKLQKNIDIFSQKIKKKSLIFLICKNSFESLVGYLGSLASDSVSVLLDENINKYHLKKLIINYNPDYIFIDKNSNKNIKNYKFVFNFFDFDLIESQKKKSKNLHPNLKLLVSTSGSNGTSKFVKLSSKNIDCNTISISKYLKISTKDNAITT